MACSGNVLGCLHCSDLGQAAHVPRWHRSLWAAQPHSALPPAPITEASAAPTTCLLQREVNGQNSPPQHWM